MRTTLTIDDDVAAALERMRRTRNVSLKDLVNEALRLGLQDMSAQPKQRQPFRTQSVTLGPLRLAGIDDIGETLALGESDAFK
jgi:hypothetical protein